MRNSPGCGVSTIGRPAASAFTSSTASLKGDQRVGIEHDRLGGARTAPSPARGVRARAPEAGARHQRVGARHQLEQRRGRLLVERMRERLEVGLRLPSARPPSRQARRRAPGPHRHRTRPAPPCAPPRLMPGSPPTIDHPAALPLVIAAPEPAKPLRGLAVGDERPASPDRRAGCPMSTTTTSPTSSRASRWPRRTPPKVIGEVGPRRAVDDPRFEIHAGRARRSRRPERSRSRIRSSSAAIGGRGAPRAPVPSSASTTTPTLGQGPSGATSRTPSAARARGHRFTKLGRLGPAAPSPTPARRAGGAPAPAPTRRRRCGRGPPRSARRPEAGARGATPARPPSARPAHSIRVASATPPATAVASQAADCSGESTGGAASVGTEARRPPRYL